jgi:putative nucleotidyltransferase with HDIG domain
MYSIAWWSSLLFALPLYTTRLAYHNFIEMREMFTQTITALAGAVDKRDPYTSKHSWRVKEIAGDIGRVMRLTEADLEALEWGGLLHDVGKIGVPDAILSKRGPLTQSELDVVRQHTILGQRVLSSTDLQEILPWVRSHHEWWDGSGYPDGLIGESIPLEARILALCDAFDAMTSDRPYRSALSQLAAIQEIDHGVGSQFDPDLAEHFIQIVSTRSAVEAS